MFIVVNQEGEGLKVVEFWELLVSIVGKLWNALYCGRPNSNYEQFVFHIDIEKKTTTIIPALW